MTAVSSKLVLTFLGVTLAMAGPAAWAAGRSLAHAWLRPPHIVAAAIGLALAACFVDYALFATPFSWARLGLDAAVTLVIAFAGYQVTRARQMRTQYPWLDGA